MNGGKVAPKLGENMAFSSSHPERPSVGVGGARGLAREACDVRDGDGA